MQIFLKTTLHHVCVLADDWKRLDGFVDGMRAKIQTKTRSVACHSTL